MFISLFSKHGYQQWHVPYLCKALELNLKKETELAIRTLVSISNILVYFFSELNMYYKLYLLWMFVLPSLLLFYGRQSLLLPRQAEWVLKQGE